MRSSSKKKMQIAGPALVAAAFGGWLAVPAVHAGFNVNVSGPITVGSNQEYVLSAVNEGNGGTFPGTGLPGTFPAGNTGSELTGVDATIIVNGGKDLVFDLVDVDGDGVPDADITGQAPHGVYTYNYSTHSGTTVTPPTPSFGASLGSGKAYTFVGIGSSTYTSGPPFGTSETTNTQATGVYINSNISTHPGGPTGPQAVYFSKQGTVDPNFTNGTVSSFELLTALTAGAPTATAGLGIPFANIVVPAGASGTVYGSLGGDAGLAADYNVTFGTTVVTSTNTTLSLTTAASFTNIGTVSISGHNGSYVPQTISTGANTIKGSLEVTGFTSGDEEVYALTAAPGTGETLAALIAELNTDVSGTNAGATAEAITPTIANLFPSADIEVDIPNAGTGSTPAFLNYDLSEDSTGPTISAIGVVPEPTGIGFLVVSGLGLLARRRRAMQA